MKKKLIAFLKITRPVNCLITFTSAIVAGVICLQGNLPEKIILLAAFSAALTTAAGNIVNDILDIEIDKINQPERPIASNKISNRSAIFFYLLLIAASLILSWFINLFSFIIVIITTILLFLYSKYFKKISLVGNIIIAFLTGLVFIYGGVAVENPSAAIIPALFAFLINLIREIVKDMQDVEGDTKAGIKTFPIRFGFQKSKILTFLITISLILYTLYPFLSQLYKIEYFVVVMIIVNPLLIYCLKKLFEETSAQSLNKISNLLKLNMVFGLIAILLG